MASVIGGLGTSHVPMIGRTIAANKQAEVPFAPFFASFDKVHAWLDEAKPDVAIVFYNDHGLTFFLPSHERSAAMRRSPGISSSR